MPLLIVTGWLSSTWLIGSIDLSLCPLLTLAILIAIRTFLQTGLFVTAHDAMHGTIAPGKPRLNWAIGQLCVTLYALLPYNLLCVNHQLHHRYPATDLDPDFSHKPCWLWYWGFIGSSVMALGGLRQGLCWLLGMAALLMVPIAGGWSIENLLWLWILPLLLSSFQLFYFGTFLPHRAIGNSSDRSLAALVDHRARSSDLHIVWSLLTCYHFGYHWEHHEYPALPWYQLPLVKKSKEVFTFVKNS
jgi:beta-carotene/zeaxanthin 4-ketolase